MEWIDKKDGDTIYAADINGIYHRGDEIMETSATNAIRAANSAAGANDAKEQARRAAEDASNVSVKPAYIGTNGNWHTWNTNVKAYIDSGKASQGPQGDTGPQGATGDKGDKGDKGDTGLQGIQGLHGVSGEACRVCRFTIGISTAGWTSADCDYLCDGTADQVEINNVIQALPSAGGEIVILDGTYNITAKININKSNVSIRGNGNATILKRMWDSTSSEGVITLTNVSYCKIKDLQIDGNKTTYTLNNDQSIRLSSSSNNTITGNTCNNDQGIHLSSSSNNTITGNTCNNDQGIRLSSSNNNTITGNTCNNNDYGIYLYSSSNNTITGNTCNNNDYGIYLSFRSNENTITGNTCNNNNYGIRLSSSNNNTITGNTCNNNNYGIHLSSSSNNTIIGNTCIRGTGKTFDYTNSQYTIKLSGTGNNYNLISSNNCRGKAVVIEDSTGNTEVNNKYE